MVIGLKANLCTSAPLKTVGDIRHKGFFLADRIARTQLLRLSRKSMGREQDANPAQTVCFPASGIVFVRSPENHVLSL